MKEKLYEDMLSDLSVNLKTLQDKPEETADSTLKALWFATAGNPLSAQLSEKSKLPELTNEQVDSLKILIDRRLNNEPLAHITGRQQFMGIELLASSDALVPRKETEILGRTAIDFLSKLAETKDELTVVYVCTGAGNLAICYAIIVPAARVFASDMSEDAVKLAQNNVVYHKLEDRVETYVGDLLSPFDNEKFYNKVDLLSCNPPYISSAKVPGMSEEISLHEPSLAFDGGAFGIKIIQKLIKGAPKYLSSGGYLIFEIGLGQGKSLLKQLNSMNDFVNVDGVADENGDIRVIVAQKIIS